MHPVFLELGPLQIRYYGLMYLAATAVGCFLLRAEVRRRALALEPSQVLDLVVTVMLSGILGARVYEVVFNWGFYGAHPAEIPAIWHGGLAIHGGMIGGVLGGWWYLRRRGVPFWPMLDAAVPAVILGQAFGRFGNFMNGEAQGPVTGLPWGIVFPPGSIAGFQSGGRPVHPTMLYEMAGCLVLFGLLWRLRRLDTRPGFLTALYFAGYSVLRFGLSFLRLDNFYVGGLSVPHAVSVLLVVVALGAVWRWELWKPAPQGAASPPPNAPQGASPGVSSNKSPKHPRQGKKRPRGRKKGGAR